MSNLDDFNKARTVHPIGHIKEMGGRKYIKTANGWKYYGKGRGTTARGHRTDARQSASEQFRLTTPWNVGVGAIIKFRGKEYRVIRPSTRGSRGRTNFHTVEVKTGNQIKLMMGSEIEARNPTEAEKQQSQQKQQKRETRQSLLAGPVVKDAVDAILTNHNVKGLNSLKILHDPSNDSLSVQTRRRRELMRIPNITHSQMRVISDLVHQSGFSVRYGTTQRGLSF